MALNASARHQLLTGACNIARLARAGYANSQVTPLTTVAGLIADIQAVRDAVQSNPAKSNVYDAAAESIQWAANNDIIDNTIVAALTTVADSTVTATTDLLYNFTGHASYDLTNWGAAPSVTTDNLPCTTA